MCKKYCKDKYVFEGDIRLPKYSVKHSKTIYLVVSTQNLRVICAFIDPLLATLYVKSLNESCFIISNQLVLKMREY